MSERKNYYVGPVAPKTRLDKPNKDRERSAYRKRDEAILRVLRTYADDRLGENDDDFDAEPAIDAAVDALTKAQAELRDVRARRAAPAKRVPR